MNGTVHRLTAGQGVSPAAAVTAYLATVSAATTRRTYGLVLRRIRRAVRRRPGRGRRRSGRGGRVVHGQVGREVPGTLERLPQRAPLGLPLLGGTGVGELGRNPQAQPVDASTARRARRADARRGSAAVERAREGKILLPADGRPGRARGITDAGANRGGPGRSQGPHGGTLPVRGPQSSPTRSRRRGCSRSRTRRCPRPASPGHQSQPRHLVQARGRCRPSVRAALRNGARAPDVLTARRAPAAVDSGGRMLAFHPGEPLDLLVRCRQPRLGRLCASPQAARLSLEDGDAIQLALPERPLSLGGRLRHIRRLVRR